MKALTKNNPGAIHSVKHLKKKGLTNAIIQRAIALGITGSELYVLTNSICNNNYDLVIYLLQNATDSELKFAVMRQSNYGLEFLKERIQQYYESKF